MSKKTKKRTFTATINLDYEMSSIGEVLKGAPEFKKKPIELKIKVPPDDWCRLAKFIKDKPGAFLREFSEQIPIPIPTLQENTFNDNDKKPRGKHKMAGWLENKIKAGAGQLYKLFSYYHKNLKEEPEYFEKLKNIAKKNGYYPNACKDQILLIGLVMFCIEKTYAGWLKGYGLKEIDKGKHKSFYNTYIVNNSYTTKYVVETASCILAKHASFLTRASFWQKHQQITP